MARNWEDIPWLKDNEGALTELYKEFGNWARHYSAVRMTLATFFVTVAFSILNFRWDKPEGVTAFSALAVILIGFVAFMLFSIATFKRMNDQIRVIDTFRKSHAVTTGGVPVGALGKRYSVWTEFSGLPLAAVFLVLFLLVEGFWYWPVWTGKTGLDHTVDVRLPVVVQPGNSKGTLEIPLKLTLPDNKTP